MEEQLKNRWLNLLTNYQLEPTLEEKLWLEIVQHYTASYRAYHNLHHLQDLFTKSELIQTAIKDHHAIQFTIWYHDIIYQSLSKQNEVKSALLCSKRLKEMGFPTAFKEKVFKLICSTKAHQVEAWDTSDDKMDNAYLLDLDLSILGTDWTAYQHYTQQVRQEYRFVPAMLYRHGRRKVLKHFLAMEQIFKTDYFYEQYEVQARENMSRELEAM